METTQTQTLIKFTDFDDLTDPTRIGLDPTDSYVLSPYSLYLALLPTLTAEQLDIFSDHTNGAYYRISLTVQTI